MRHLNTPVLAVKGRVKGRPLNVDFNDCTLNTARCYHDWKTVSCKGHEPCGVKNDGTLWCWDAFYSLAPTQIGSGTNWKTIASTGNHICGIKTNGTLWCWGLNDKGQLGDGEADHPFRVKPITLIGP